MIKTISINSGFKEEQVRVVLDLTAEGYTVPFIARYRKEQTGNLSEIELRVVLKEFERLTKLEERKIEILQILEERNYLTNELKSAIKKADKLSLLEEIYKPYKKKQKSKALIAREKGLETVAHSMLRFRDRRRDDFKQFIGSEFSTQEEILEEASHILIEDIANNINLRSYLKELYKKRARFVSKKKKGDKLDTASLYKNYYDFSKPLKYMESFQTLAINRGEKEKILTSSIEIEMEIEEKIEWNLRIKSDLAYYPEVCKAVKKAYKSFLKPSLVRELKGELTEDAENRSIKVFSSNLRALLLKRPYTAKGVIGLDPGFRTGCKVAVVNSIGQLLEHTVIYPVPPHNKVEQSKKILAKLVKKHGVDVIAIGDGTASYETSVVVAEAIQDYNLTTGYTIISESGASVYSASQNAIDEFPDLDLTIRSAVSIGRRILSFLDEVVKIPPESIGVGMYQHDINSKKLVESLDFEVASVVHHVGVDINRASMFLLKHISGISASLAKKIVEYREEVGLFKDRKELLKVKGFGKKAFELASGFCRVTGSKNPLDNTIIHPDDYYKVVAMLSFMGIKKRITTISRDELRDILLENPKEKLYNSELKKADIEFVYEAIVKRAVDPRESLEEIIMKDKVASIDDFVPYSIWQGEVKNITDFGIFVSLGIKTDGLLHVSQFRSKAEMFAKNYPGRQIDVMVESVDIKRNRIELSLIKE